MPRNNMPANWEPPAPAWQSRWKDTGKPLIAAFFGVQAEQPGRLETWARTAFSGAYAPLAFEQGAYTDQNQVPNYLYIAYWPQDSYRCWWELDRHSGWWRDPRRLEDGAGYWREVISMPFDRFETLHSTKNPHGVGVFASGMDGPILEHGYAGGMRDRIPLSDSDALRATESLTATLAAQKTDAGRRVLVTPPQNLCVIRSGQNWTLCEPGQKKYYLDKLHPVLLEGMRFLQDHPVETNCYSLRFVDQKDASWGPLQQSFGLGYATDVHAFENWAKSHPTHVAIFNGFLEMVEIFGQDLKLQLWHEVTALPGDGCEFEYIACHPHTGLLGYT